MRRSRHVWSGWMLYALLVFALAGCGAGDGASPDGVGEADSARIAAPAEGDVLATAIAVAKEIEADPDAAEDILARHGLDAEAFEAMMYDIADDPEKSRAYNEAVFGAR